MRRQDERADKAACLGRGKPDVKDYGRDDHNYQVACSVCGAKPTVADTGLCGPCCFGEADTVGGNW